MKTRLAIGMWLGIAGAALAGSPGLPRSEPSGELELVATFDGPMPTGVAVSRDGRIFVNFPRWGDRVDFTVAELKDGQPVAYPEAELNRLDIDHAAETLVSVQSVVVDSSDRLWILDTGRPEWKPTVAGGPKLVGVDLKTNKVFRKIALPAEVALPTTYLNDVRFDLRRGSGGLAFITDSSTDGPNALIVVDLASGRSWRRLHDHPSTKPDANFLPIVEGRPLLSRPGTGPGRHMTVGADGIALSPDGQTLYYCALSTRRLYSVKVDALADEHISEQEVARTVVDFGDRGFASDGLECDAQGRLLLTDYEDNAILRRNADGQYETLVADPRLLWPDTLSLTRDGVLYCTANQLHRQSGFQGGVDKRVRPYALFRIRVDSKTK